MASETSLSTDGGRIVKMEVDYSSTCDDKIPECIAMAKQGHLHNAIDTLLGLEKQTRTVSTSLLFITLLLIFRASMFKVMNCKCVDSSLTLPPTKSTVNKLKAFTRIDPVKFLNT